MGFVDVNDNAGARAGMNAIIFSSVIERSAGIETIPHLTTRDYTIMGLEAQLFGAHAEGVRNILAVTGDPPEVGDYPGSRGIYEIDSIGLTELLSKLNRGEDYNGRPIDAPTSFFIGVAVNPTADDLDLEVERYQNKIEAGAQFAMTQLIFDLAHLDAFFERFGGREAGRRRTCDRRPRQPYRRGPPMRRSQRLLCGDESVDRVRFGCGSGDAEEACR